MTKKVKEVVHLLEMNGWRYIGTRGDHHKYYKEGARRPIIVPGRPNDDLKEGTYYSILKEAGLK